MDHSSAFVVENAKESPELVDELFSLINESYSVEKGKEGVAFKFGERYDSLDDFRQLFSGGDDTALLILRHTASQDLAGAVFVAKTEDSDTATFGPLAVAKKYQKQKLGKRLVKEAEDWAKKNLKSLHMQIGVVNHRSDLFPFYSSLGYERTGTAPWGNQILTTRPSHFVLLTKSLNA